jgi:hypothetical protein
MCSYTTDGQNYQAYLWQYGRPGGGVALDFRLGGGRDGPKDCDTGICVPPRNSE